MPEDTRTPRRWRPLTVNNARIRVQRPVHPASGVPHNFLFVLPVEPAGRTTYGKGLHTLRALRAHDHYNLTIIEPSFPVEPWYADNPADPAVRQESFMVTELAPWARDNVAVTGREQIWLIGFSKSGIGGHGLLLRHPDVFECAASWDFPAGMAAYDEYGKGPAACYGTDASFQARYRLTPEFVRARKEPFLRRCRMWIGAGPVFGSQVRDYAAVLAAEGVRYRAGAVAAGAHRWDGGWVSAALAGLRACATRPAHVNSDR